jgi:hypothetical protein
LNILNDHWHSDYFHISRMAFPNETCHQHWYVGRLLLLSSSSVCRCFPFPSSFPISRIMGFCLSYKLTQEYHAIDAVIFLSRVFFCYHGHNSMAKCVLPICRYKYIYVYIFCIRRPCLLSELHNLTQHIAPFDTVIVTTREECMPYP